MILNILSPTESTHYHKISEIDVHYKHVYSMSDSDMNIIFMIPKIYTTTNNNVRLALDIIYLKNTQSLSYKSLLDKINSLYPDELSLIIRNKNLYNKIRGVFF